MFLNIMICGYALVAAIFFCGTFLEGWSKNGRWTLYRLAGLMATLFWPLLIVFFLLHISVTRAYARYVNHGEIA